MTRPLPPTRTFGVFEMLRAMRDPRGAFTRAIARDGDPIVVKGPAGPLTITASPAGVREIFAGDPDAFGIYGHKQLAPFFGATSLLLVAGARHKRDRKLLAPPFHGARMRAYGATMASVAERTIGAIPVGQSFKMHEATQTISLTVILQTVFGVSDDARVERFRTATERLMASIVSPMIHLFPSLRREFGGIGPWARFRRASKAFDELMFEEIRTRRSGGATGEDILGLLMNARFDDGTAMSDEDLRDELLVLLFAGHETTASALAWAFYWLCTLPDEREKVLAEIDALGDRPGPEAIAALPYLEAFCHETLRINPVVTEVGRLLLEPMQLMDCTVPTGNAVMASIMMLHDREDLYPEPRTFRASRFLERKFAPYEFIPFGGGARRCVGAAFAMYEMKVVLGTLLRKYRFRLVSDAPVVAAQRGVTWGPKGGIPMVVEGPREST